MLVVAGDLDRSTDAFSLLAQVNATLFVALAIDAHSAISMAGRGLPGPKQVGLQFGLLAVFVFGAMFALGGAFIADPDTPGIISFEWAIAISFAYAYAAALSAVVLIGVHAGARLLGIVGQPSTDNPSVGSRSSSNAPAQPDEQRLRAVREDETPESQRL